jgi:hypothetical protein
MKASSLCSFSIVTSLSEEIDTDEALTPVACCTRLRNKIGQNCQKLEQKPLFKKL